MASILNKSGGHCTSIITLKRSHIRLLLSGQIMLNTVEFVNFSEINFMFPNNANYGRRDVFIICDRIIH
jgi:NADH:ubiquinone oxidoreductase subunit K